MCVGPDCLLCACLFRGSLTVQEADAPPSPPPPRRPDKFRAFVVGNNAYQHLWPLGKCVDDARAMGALLERKGYAVTLLEDADVGGFEALFSQFASSLCSGCTVVLHFSGHGFQAAGSNRLLFVDQSEDDAVECTRLSSSHL
jgi:uncharacterized caspase-like protein